MAWVAGIGAVAGLAANAMNNSANASMNRDTRQWQTEMSNTEVQRRVADLKAAGLNPMLAYNGAAGTPSPSNIAMQSGASDAEKGASSAMAAYLARAQKTQAQLQGDVLASQADKNAAESAQAAAMSKNINMDTQLKQQTVGRVVADTELATTNSVNAKLQARNIQQEYDNLFQQGQKIAAEAEGTKLDNRQKAALMPIVQQMQQLELKREQLQMPRMENESKAQGTWWMRNVSPFLPDVLKSAGGAAAAGSAYRSFGK